MEEEQRLSTFPPSFFVQGSHQHGSPKPDFLIKPKDGLSETKRGFCGFPELTEFMVDDHNIFVSHYFDPQTQKKAKITVLSGFIKSWEGHGRFTNVL